MKKNKIYPFLNILNLWKFLRRRKKHKVVYLLFLMIFQGFSEILSVATLIPFITAITAPEKITSLFLISNFIEILRLNKESEILIFISTIFALTVIISGLLRVFCIYKIYNISKEIVEDLSSLAYRKIIYLPYENYIQRNSSESIVALNLFSDYTVNSITAFLSIISSIIVMSCLLSSIIFLNWKLVLTCFIFIFINYLFFTIRLKKNFSIIAKNLVSTSQKLVRLIQESFRAKKNIDIDNLHEEYNKIFKKVNQSYRDSHMKSSLYTRLPRYIIESTTLVGIAILTIFLILIFKVETNYLIILLGVLAVSVQRILPQFQQIYGALNTINTNKKGVIKFLNILKIKNDKNNNIFLKNTNLTNIFKDDIKLIKVSYKLDEKYILKDINLQIKKGSTIGIVGKTGSGKSTLVNILTSLIKPTSGRFLIDNNDLYSETSIEKRILSWRSKIALVPQEIYMSEDSVKQNIAFGLSSNKIDIEKVFKCAKVSELDDSFISKDGINKHIEEGGFNLSGGQRQRIAIARALFKEAEILFFDEATSSLDSLTEGKIMQSIYSMKGKITVILISHNQKILEKCDEIYEIKNKSIRKIK